MRTQFLCHRVIRPRVINTFIGKKYLFFKYYNLLTTLTRRFVICCRSQYHVCGARLSALDNIQTRTIDKSLVYTVFVGLRVQRFLSCLFKLFLIQI